MELRDFQRMAKEKLSNGYSVIIIAPTGLGKTLAAILPYIENLDQKNYLRSRLSIRMIYTLPIRALAKGVQEELQRFNINAVIHHGDEPESNIFSEKVIITTVDQYFAAFAGAPLSWISSVSHAAAGATLVNYTIFDEIHLLSPKNGLQLLFAILKLRNRWGLPTAVMSATLPDAVIDFLKDKCKLIKVESSKKDVKNRDSWRKILLTLHDEEMDINQLSKFIKEKYSEYRRIIIFVNTVDKAINIYSKLKKDGVSNILLAHSRFAKNDRIRIENEIHKKFGKDSDFEGILITTQVAEAGLNISAPLVITELSPMDSLVQRIGRCARFKENGEIIGEVIIIRPEIEKDRWYSPYIDRINIIKKGKPFIKISLGRRKKELRSLTVSEITWAVLINETQGGTKKLKLNWTKEKELINLSLNAPYRAFIHGRNYIDVENDLKNSKYESDQKLYDILSEEDVMKSLIGGD